MRSPNVNFEISEHCGSVDVDVFEFQMACGIPDWLQVEVYSEAASLSGDWVKGLTPLTNVIIVCILFSPLTIFLTRLTFGTTRE